MAREPLNIWRILLLIWMFTPFLLHWMVGGGSPRTSQFRMVLPPRGSTRLEWRSPSMIGGSREEKLSVKLEAQPDCFIGVQVYLWHGQIPVILWLLHCSLLHRCRCPCHLCSPSPPPVHCDRSFGRSELQRWQKRQRKKSFTGSKYFLKQYISLNETWDDVVVEGPCDSGLRDTTGTTGQHESFTFIEGLISK